MKILCVNYINFKAGKVHFFSDFDGTYLAVKLGDIKRGENIPQLRSYADCMDKFFKSTDNHLDFHITTGRKEFGSYKRASELFKQNDIRLPLPDSFIIANGYLEYLITNKNHDFYGKGAFPYDETRPIARPHGAEKSKAYNPKSMLESAIKNDDIIIVAGNHGNDKEMLNPLRYIDFKEYEKKSANKSFYQKNTEEMLIDLKAVYDGKNSDYINSLRKEFESNGLLKRIEELPIYSVIVTNPSEEIPESMKLIKDTFESQGKVVEVEKGKLDEALKQIIKNHGNKSKKFKDGMSKKFREFIFGKAYGLKIGIVSTIIALSGIAGITIYKRNQQPSVEEVV